MAADLLDGLGERAERIGGVRVEREIIQDTLARALVDAGEHVRAAELLHRRTTTRHHHVYEDLLLAGTVWLLPGRGAESSVTSVRVIVRRTRAPRPGAGLGCCHLETASGSFGRFRQLQTALDGFPGGH
ncbi:hypothetical protein OG599_14380 [Streptomyces sp. NBC_01335]|uniref:hypothetical protein n=1 Tax=Streptomyces sp. NBC_01335 TaxID=2903828 RepID=UPI002E0ED4B4|nr:hypothetical protein OG599_14380 [Streptomyces sp. NBC_01335]